jgi:hypothetical protein
MTLNEIQRNIDNSCLSNLITSRCGARQQLLAQSASSRAFARQSAGSRVGCSFASSTFLRKKRGKIGAGPSRRPKTVKPNFS